MAEQRVRYVIEAQNLLSKVLRQLEGEATKTGAAIEGIGKGGGGVGGKSGMMGSIAGGNLIASGIQRAAGAMIEFGKQSVQSFAKFEQFGVALTTMFHGNREEAKMLSDELVNFAKTTPFELTEIQDATKQLIAYGSTSGSVGKELRILGDISSGVGAPIGEIAYLYGTARTQGRLFSRDIYQFSGRGIPIVEALAKQFGVAKSEIMKMVEEGKVGFPELQKAMISMTEKGGQFAGMMEAQSKTLGGQLSNLSDSWEQLKVNIGGSQQGILKDTIAWTTKMVNLLGYQAKFNAQLGGNLERSGVRKSGFLTRDIGFEEVQTEKNASVELFKEYMQAGRFDLATIIREKLEAEAKTLQFQLQHKGLLSRTMGLTNEQETGMLEKNLGKAGILEDALKSISGFTKTFYKQKKEGKLTDETITTKAGKDKISSSKLGTGTTIESGAPKNMYINVNKLVETLKVESVSGEVPVSQIKTQVSKLFLEMLNDVHLAQR